MVGRMPVAFLNLDLPPEEVDVNVHPTKIEVRFRDGHRVYSQLLSTVRQTFLASDLHSRLQAPPAPAVRPEQMAPQAEAAPFVLAESPVDRQDVASWFTPSKTAFQTFPSPGYAGGSTVGTPPAWAANLPPAPGRQAGFSEFAEEESPAVATMEAEAPPASRQGAPLKAIQVHDTYLVVETDDGMVVIDQHALHERILYEELKARLEQGGVEAQRLLVPEPVDLAAPEAAAVLERKDVLARLGLEIEPFGGDTVLVSSLPAMLRGAEAGRLLRDLADHFRSSPIDPSADAVLEDVLNMVACKAAVKANQRLAPEEVAALVERRHLVDDSHHCPHGRPTALVFTRSELEKQFGRI
jgi:DNA mismatch repair protein MutL